MKPLLIEVGAYDGTDSLQFYRKGYEVFTFEPKRDLYASLLMKTRKYPDYTVINSAVSLKDGATKFNICAAGGASSILEFKTDDELHKHWGKDRKDILYSGESYDVLTTRLDTFIELFDLRDRKIDFLHIDAQGVDLEVLQSLGVYIKNLQAGVVETVLEDVKSIYKDQKNNIESLKEFFIAKGFEIDKIECNDGTKCEWNVYFSRI